MSTHTWCLYPGQHPNCTGQHPNCPGWQAYAAQHERLHNRVPDETDIKVDRLLMEDSGQRALAATACDLYGHLWHQPELELYADDVAVADQCGRCGSLRHDADAAPLSDDEAAAFLALVQSYAKEAPTS